jgi:hypothetical protein
VRDRIARALGHLLQIIEANKWRLVRFVRVKCTKKKSITNGRSTSLYLKERGKKRNKRREVLSV